MTACEQISSLLAVAALDAVHDEERMMVDRHLAECAPCASEYAGYQEIARLVAFAATPLSEDRLKDLWLRLDESITSDLGATGVEVRPIHPRSQRKYFAAVVGAAAVVLGAVVITTSHSGQSHHTGVALPSIAHTIAPSSASSSARPSGGGPTGIAPATIALKTPDGVTSAKIVQTATGGQYFVNSSLSSGKSNQTLQLWGVSQGQTVSLGVLGPNPTVVPVHVTPTVSAVTVTVEPVGGAPTPSAAVVAEGSTSDTSSSTTTTTAADG